MSAKRGSDRLPAETEPADDHGARYTSWQHRWSAASVGPAGYWRRHTVGEGFRTAGATSDQMAGALLGLLDDHPSITRVIDIGAGDGELITELARRAPRLRCLGLDLRTPPPGPPTTVGWLTDWWRVESGRWALGALAAELARSGQPTLIIAAEWLDDLALPVFLDGKSLDVDGRGNERPADHDAESPEPVITDELQAWIRRWWPVGQRVEVGRTRDLAWSAVIDALGPSGGLAVMIDYGHTRETRPARGSLHGYRAGRVTDPIPDGRHNLTAAVAVDSIRAAGEAAGASTVWFSSQRDALTRFAGPIPTELASAGDQHDSDDQQVLAELARRSRAATMRSAAGFGDHWWLVQQVARSAPAPASRRSS